MFLVTRPISLRRGINSLRVSFRRDTETRRQRQRQNLSARRWSRTRRRTATLRISPRNFVPPRLQSPEVVEFAMSSVRLDGEHSGHGWTRIHTDKNKSLLIRVNPCPSVAELVLPSWARSHSSRVPKLWVDLRSSVTHLGAPGREARHVGGYSKRQGSHISPLPPFANLRGLRVLRALFLVLSPCLCTTNSSFLCATQRFLCRLVQLADRAPGP